MQKTLALLLALNAIAAHAATIQPTGYYVMQGVHKTNVSDSVIASKSLTGFHLRDSWDLVEPKRGTFNFTFYDQQLARAARLNKHVTFGLYAGVASDPSWSHTLADFTAAVAALGARYNANPLIDAVHLSAPQVSDDSMEMYVPSSWHGTNAQAITIWEQSIDAYNRAFPNKTLVLDLAMAPDSKGAITKAVDEYARATLGDRFNAIVCNLKATTSLTAPHIVELKRLHSEGVRIGFEMVGPSSDQSRFGGSFAQAIGIGNSLGGQWYQIYQADVPNIPRITLFAGAIPEPSSAGLIAIALFLVAAFARYRTPAGR